MMIRRLKLTDVDPEEAPVLTAMDKHVAPTLFTRERIVMAAIAVVVFAIGTYGYVRFGLTSSVTVDAERLSLATVARGVFHEYVPVTGNVVPRTTVYLDAIAGGQVAELLVEEGAQVTAGQPLLVLKNANLQLDIAQREANLAQQLYQLNSLNQSLDERRLQRARELTEIDFQIRSVTAQLNRKKPLLEVGAVPAMEIEEMELNLQRFRGVRESVGAAQAADNVTRPAQVAQLKQSIDLITNNLTMTRQNLDALTIRAPIAGQLTMLDAEIGAAKNTGQRIGQVDSAEGFKVRANIPEFYLARVVLGQRATAEIDGQSHAMTVAKVYPGVKEREFAVDFAFETQPPAIRRGQTLRLKLEIGEAGDSLMVANGAFREDSAGQWVFVLAPGSSSAERRPVSLGRYNPDHVEVLGGLVAGERIVTSSYGPYLKFDRIDIRGLSQGEP